MNRRMSSRGTRRGAFRWMTPIAVSTALGAFWLCGSAPASAGPAGKSFTSCPTEAELATAVAAHGTITFGLNCTVAFTSAITVTSGTTDIEGNGFNVSFTGGGVTRFFTQSGGTLTLGDLTLQGGLVTGASGTAGAGGSEGSVGAAGTLNQPGGNGGAAGAGKKGKPGKSAEGGAVDVVAGTLNLNNDNLSGDGATGGGGGAGGNGGTGGSGGTGGQGANGVAGSSGGSGGAGGNGGKGGAGGAAYGGAVYNAGTLNATNTNFNGDTVRGGSGGYGGAGLNGGSGGIGGQGGEGVPPPLNFGHDGRHGWCRWCWWCARPWRQYGNTWRRGRSSRGRHLQRGFHDRQRRHIRQ